MPLVLFRPCRFVISALAALCLVAPAIAQTDSDTEGNGNTLTLTLDTGAPASPAASPKATRKVAPTRSTSRRNTLPLPSRSGSRTLRQPPMVAPKVLAQLGYVVEAQAELRVNIETGSRLLSKVPKGTHVAVVAESGNYWGVLMLNNTVGWTPKSSLEMLDYQTQVAVPASDPAGDMSEDNSLSNRTDDYVNHAAGDMPPPVQGALREAFTYLGVPYVWGGESRGGLDCSAFVRSVFRTQGIDLPRHSGDQIAIGRAVAAQDLRAGDRLYFDCSTRRSGIDHTGIYLGNGLFINASGGVGKVCVQSLFRPIYYRGLVAIRRDFE